MTTENAHPHVERGGPLPAILPFAVVATGAWAWAIDLAGIVDDTTLGVSSWMLLTLLGPALLPWLTLTHALEESPVASLSRSIERWRRAGAAAWIGRGLLAGAALGAPCLLIPIVGGPAILALPLLLGGAIGFLASTRRWWWRSADGPGGSWPMVCVTTISLLGPLLVSMGVAAPMWRVDRTQPLPLPPDVSNGYRVDLEDAPLFVIGITLRRGEEREIVRAPLGIFGHVTLEPNRARLVSDHGLGDYVVPLSDDGERLDDDALSRVLARLDLGGGIPIAMLVVVAAVLALFWVMRVGSDLSRFAWLGLTTLALLEIAWGF